MCGRCVVDVWCADPLEAFPLKLFFHGAGTQKYINDVLLFPCRLGKGGIDEIMQHEWFTGRDLRLLLFVYLQYNLTMILSLL